MLTGAGIGYAIVFVFGLIDDFENIPEGDDTGKKLLAFIVVGGLIGFLVRHSIF